MLKLYELSVMLSVFTILGIIAIWGEKGFYPFWLICAVIYLYHTMSNPLLPELDNYPLLLLKLVYYTIISPFWLLIATYSLLIMLIEVWLETRNGSKKQT
jgi:hypothetical protein